MNDYSTSALYRLRAALAALALAASPMLSAEDTSEGKRLYEARCGECHGEDAHTRLPRAVQSHRQLQDQVKLWDTVAGGPQWTPQELTSVVAYLNERFYRLPQR